MATIQEQYGDLLSVQPCPAWAGYPGEGNPGGREMIRDEAHPCHGCPLEADHLVPGRAWFPGHGAGEPLPFPAEYAWPGVDTLYRMMCINDQLFHAAFGPVTGIVSNRFDGMGNLFSAEVVSGDVVAASGNTLTLKSLVNPFDLLIQRWVENPDFDGVDEEEPRYLNLGIRTRVQPGDILGFDHSLLTGKVVCRVTDVLGFWGGPESTWQLRVDQSVGHADLPALPYFTQARFGVTREAIAPRNWPELRGSAPLWVARIEGLRISYADYLDSSVFPRHELRDTGGASCRIALPLEPNPSLGFAGSFQALRKAASGGTTDVTSAVAATLQVRHVGASGYRTTIDPSAHLLADGDELVLTYEPAWRSADGAEAKRASCQSICHHSKYSPKLGWACGLAGRRILDPDDDNNPANDPPDGLPNYRTGSTAGCYQPGACSDFQARTPWSYQTQFGALLMALHNGNVCREDQGFPGSVDPSNYSTTRPPFPSGVPGLGPMAGRVGRTADGYHATTVLVPGATPGFGWVTGSHGSRVIRYGAEIELTDGIRQHDLGAGETPKTGIFQNRFSGGSVDGFGGSWNAETDPTYGFRDAGGRAPSCSRADTGDVLGLTEGDGQRATARRVIQPRVALGAGSTSLQAGDRMDAQLGEDDTLALTIHPLGGRYDTGAGLNAKVSGVIAAASVDGDLIKIQIANQPRQCTVAGPGFENHTQHLTGGHFVKLADAYQPFDPNDAESAVEAANMYRGAMRGDSVRVSGAGGSQAADIAATGYYVMVAKACAGAEQAWDGSNPAPPAGWIAAPKNYEDWLAKRDVVWVRDRDDGILAANLSNLVGASIVCVVGGIIAPTAGVTLYRAAYRGDWEAVPAEAVESIDHWLGRVVLAADYIQDLDRTVQHCFRVDCSLMDRRHAVAAFHFHEVARRQGLLTGMSGVVGNGIDGRRYTIDQTEEPFIGGWGVTQRDLQGAEMFDNTWTLLGTPFDPDAAAGGASAECNEGYYVLDEAILGLEFQAPGSERNLVSMSARASSGISSYRQLRRSAEIRLRNYVGLSLLGTIANWPAGTEVVSASCNIRMGGLSHFRKLVEFEPDGLGGFAVTETVETDTEGSGSFRLGLYGYRVNPATGEGFISLLGSGGTVSTTNGEWRTIDITDVVKQAVAFKDSEWLALSLVPVPTSVDIAAGSDPGEALAAMLPEVEWETYEPTYSGCSGDPAIPAINPGAYDRAGSYHAETIEWGDFEATAPFYVVSWPANFGEDILTLNDSNLHCWPPKP